MSSRYDPLDDQGSEDEPSGVTPLEISELPADQRNLLLWMLRDQHASTHGISADGVMAGMRNAPDDCAALMAYLAQDGWLLVYGDPPNEIYKVNLRRKRGNSGMNLWNSVLEE